MSHVTCHTGRFVSCKVFGESVWVSVDHLFLSVLTGSSWRSWRKPACWEENWPPRSSSPWSAVTMTWLRHWREPSLSRWSTRLLPAPAQDHSVCLSSMLKSRGTTDRLVSVDLSVFIIHAFDATHKSRVWLDSDELACLWCLPPLQSVYVQMYVFIGSSHALRHAL